MGRIGTVALEDHGQGLARVRRDHRRGQNSIRVNDKWRVCFRWRERDAYDVEIVDYHGG